MELFSKTQNSRYGKANGMVKLIQIFIYYRIITIIIVIVVAKAESATTNVFMHPFESCIIMKTQMGKL